MRQFFTGVPDELEESAYIDGSGTMRTFFQIILPLSVPMLITVFFSSLVFFGVYYLPHTMELCGLSSPTWLPATNHRLWLAFCLYLAVRSIVQSFLARRVLTIEERLSQCPT